MGDGERSGHRHSFSLLATAGVYGQQGFAAGPVGGLWLESDSDSSGRAALVVGAGARSQLYDGSRSSIPVLPDAAAEVLMRSRTWSSS